MKKCENCGKMFQERHNRQMCCSRECSFERKKKKTEERKKQKEDIEKKKEFMQNEWKRIGKIMAETHKSYGQLQREGII